MVKETYVAISGGFDPLHDGHIDLIESAAEFGKVIVILNSDEWLKKKKGYYFMGWEQRRRMLEALRDVYSVIAVNDKDGTVCAALCNLGVDYFANGGDRNKKNTPELKMCKQLGVKPLFGIGGKKTNSSSNLVKKAAYCTKQMYGQQKI